MMLVTTEYPMRKLIVAIAPVFACLLTVLSPSFPLYAQSVFYEADTVPNADPIAPWTAIGEGNRQTSVSGGILTLGDPDASTFNWFHRTDYRVGISPELHLSARVRVLSNNGFAGSPGLAIYDYDATLPMADFAHYWYSVHFFTDRLELGWTDRDANTGGVFAIVSVPDFSTAFHDVELVKIDGNDRTLKLYLDQQPVATVAGQSRSRTLDGIGFGYGLYAGTGLTEWDYVRYSLAHPPCAQLPPGSVSWWPGDDNANDIVDGNAGSLLGGTSCTPAQVEDGFGFDSNDDRVVVAHNSNLDVHPSGFTIEFWAVGIKNQPDPLSCIVEKSHGWTDSTGWAIHVFNAATGFPSFAIGDGTGFPNIVGSVDILDGRFHHIAGTWEAGVMRLYVDGVLQGSATNSTPANNTRDLNVGFTWGGGTPQRFFRGVVDEVRVFDRALSACEIKAIHHSVSGGQCKADTDGDFFLDFNDNCPSVANSGQADADSDGAGDACDCAPADPAVLAAPEESGLLQVGVDNDKSKLTWCSAAQSAGTATAYDVLRGATDELPVGAGASEICLASGISTPAQMDPAIPLPDSSFFYLVRGRNSCGVGTYGYQSNGTERITSTCP